MKLNITLRSIDEVTADLDLGAVYPRLVRAEEAATIAEAELADARQRLTEATVAVDELPGAVRRGEATAADLQAALRAQQAAALAVPEAEQAADQARADLGQARRDAGAAVEAEARRRAKALQSEADKLAVVLEEIRVLEIHLIDAANAAVAGTLDESGRPLSVSLPALRWPSSNAQEGLTLAIAHQRDLAETGLTPAAYAQRFGRGGRDGAFPSADAPQS